MHKFFLLITSVLFVGQLSAQDGKSPYSAIGVGLFYEQGNARNSAMGGAGISSGHVLYSNILNPALSTFQKYTVFEAGYAFGKKELSTTTESQTTFGGNISYFNLAFPLAKNWGMSLGIRPLTTVNFASQRTERIPMTPSYIVYDNKGEGGLSQVFFSNGFNINKFFSVGLEASYNFGRISRTLSSKIDDATNEYIVNSQENENYSYFRIKPGVLVQKPFSDNRYLNFGATYEVASTADIRYRRELLTKLPSESVVNRDTVSIDTVSTFFPSSFVVGLSYEKLGKYSLNLDYEHKGTQNFKDYKGASPLANGYRISLGAEYTPDAASISSPWKRIVWRAGLRYEQSPLIFQGTQLNDYAASLGFTIPLAKGFSAVTASFTYGVLGEKSDKLMEENYLRARVALTINDVWFVRRKFN